MKIVIIKYNSGNVRSVAFSLERIGVEAMVSDEINEIQTADKIIFPGVGEASSAMKYLKEKKLGELIISLAQPVLGICLGMQLMCKYSEEGNTDCLGIFDQDVKRFESNEQLKVPQIGWNDCYDLGSPLFKGISENSCMYFVHGYYAGVGNDTIGKTNYGMEYSSAIRKKNFYGVQFHPEKSGIEGQKIMQNFLEL